MLLEKFATMLDSRIINIVLEDLTDDSRERINCCFENAQDEINVMDWVINERHVQELTNPIPDLTTEIRDRNDNINNNNQ